MLKNAVRHCTLVPPHPLAAIGAGPKGPHQRVQGVVWQGRDVQRRILCLRIRSILRAPTRPSRTPPHNVAARRASPLALDLLRPMADDGAPPLATTTADDNDKDKGTTMGTPRQ